MGSRLASIAAGSVILTATVIACGGKIASDFDTTDPNDTTKSQRPPGDDSDATKTDRAKAKPPSGGSSPPSPPSLPPRPPPEPSTSCSFQGGSASGGMSGGGGKSCQSDVMYTCPDRGSVTLSCSCEWAPGAPSNEGKGSCKCNDRVFDFDCTRSTCSLGADEYAKCNLPEP